jgi:hypothetical protein
MNGPWWVDGAWDFVKSRLNSKSFVFEWGSGQSTTCLAEITKNIVSVENNAEWYSMLSDQLGDMIKFIPDNGKAEGHPSNPEDFTSASKYYNRRDFKEYVMLVRDYSNIDLTIVDGRARPSCIIQCLDLIAPGGMLLVDDSWRPHYQKAIEQIPKEWGKIVFKSKGIEETTIWTR